MLIKMDSGDKSLGFYSYTSSTTYGINELIFLIPKDEFSPKQISSLAVRIGDYSFSLAILSYVYNNYKNYYQCTLSTNETLHLQGGSYKIYLENGDTIYVSTDELKIEEFYNANPKVKELTLVSSEAYYTQNDLVNTQFIFKFNRFDNEEDLSIFQPIIRIIAPTGEKRVKYINDISSTSELVEVHWHLDDDAEKELPKCLFTCGLISPLNDIFYETEIYSYVPDTGLMVADNKDEYYREFLEWKKSAIYYLLEGTYELRDYENLIPIKGRFIDMTQNKNIIIQHDHKSEVISFKMERFQDGIDVSKKKIFIKYVNAENEKLRSKAVNVVVDDNYIIFSWLITHTVSKSAGIVHFIVEIVGTPDEEGKDWYWWNTEVATLTILPTLVFEDDLMLNTDDFDYKVPEWYRKLSEAISTIEAKKVDGGSHEDTWIIL